MILFVFEGKREHKWFHPINHFFLKDEVIEYYIVGTTFHLLYQNLISNEWDIVGTLKQMEHEKGECKLAPYNSSDFAEIYLFFDYDPHSRGENINRLNTELDEMLTFFDNETINGKLYINYPMIEALRYTKELPDKNYSSYTYPITECANFKKSAAEFSAYSGTTFLTNRDIETQSETRNNWELLKTQNVLKANYICNNKESLPTNKEDIGQKKIFINQLTKYVNTDNPRVSILSSLAIFINDYLK